MELQGMIDKTGWLLTAELTYGVEIKGRT